MTKRNSAVFRKRYLLDTPFLVEELCNNQGGVCKEEERCASGACLKAMSVGWSLPGTHSRNCYHMEQTSTRHCSCQYRWTNCILRHSLFNCIRHAVSMATKLKEAFVRSYCKQKVTYWN